MSLVKNQKKPTHLCCCIDRVHHTYYLQKVLEQIYRILLYQPYFGKTSYLMFLSTLSKYTIVYISKNSRRILFKRKFCDNICIFVTN